ncbi:MAG: C4-type zinc ribbon domain-containing protein [bacterium]|nr:C4-type zinc ribbon domain-containing protein [bacterium]
MNQLRQDMIALLEIQEKERELLGLEEEKAGLPAVLEEARARLSEAERGLAAARADIKALQVQRKELELESESVLQAIAKYEAQQFQVKTNAEYQALSKEIAERKVANARIEDRILESMERIEEAESAARLLGEAVERERGCVAAEEERIVREAARLDGRIGALGAERDALLPGVSPVVLGRYRRIFSNKRDAAVVPLTGYTCGGCHMRLPPQIANNVRKWDQLVICENCSRILYWADGLSVAEDAAQPDAVEGVHHAPPL